MGFKQVPVLTIASKKSLVLDLGFDLKDFRFTTSLVHTYTVNSCSCVEAAEQQHPKTNQPKKADTDFVN